jgi:hypothetical protein
VESIEECSNVDDAPIIFQLTDHEIVRRAIHMKVKT